MRATLTIPLDKLVNKFNLKLLSRNQWKREQLSHCGFKSTGASNFSSFENHGLLQISVRILNRVRNGKLFFQAALL